MNGFRIVAAALLLLAVAAPPASAGTVTYDGVFVSFAGDAARNVVTFTRVSGTQVTFKDTAVAPTVAAGSEATCSAAGDTVTCSVGGNVLIRGNGGDDDITLGGTATGFTTVEGGAGIDLLVGGAGDDELNGGPDNDEIDGMGGIDSLDTRGPGQNDGADLIDGGEGSDRVGLAGTGDVVRDTGTTGVDSLDLFDLDAGGRASVNGIADDGPTAAPGSDVQNGFEVFLGSSQADVIVGGAAAEDLRGFGGADQLTGGGATDRFDGGAGTDTLDSADGVADTPIICGADADTLTRDDQDSPNADCETVTVTATATPTPTATATATASAAPSATATATATASATATAAPSATATAAPAESFPFPIAEIVDTTRSATVPDVVGRPVSSARATLVAAVPNVAVTINLSRRCAGKQTLEVLKQNPAAGTSLQTSEGDVGRVAIDVCDGGTEFLSDCARKALAKDVDTLPGKAEAGVGTELLLRLAECKVDVDVQVPKTAPTPKASQPKISFDTIRRKGGKAAIESTLRCSRTQQDFAVALGEGQQIGSASNALFGLAEAGGQWKLPAHPSGSKSIVELQVQNRGSDLPPAEVYVDADAVRPGTLSPGQVFLTDGGGHAQLQIVATRPGTIRLCVVQRVGEGVATWAGQIEVVRADAGDTWTTVMGRSLKVTELGEGRLITRSVATSADLGDLIRYLIALFDGRSRTVAAQETAQGSVAQKGREVFRAGRVGVMQITLDGKLIAGAAPPLLGAGTCLSGGAAAVVASTCPVLLARGGHAVIGGSTNGTPLVAAGGGNVLTKSGRLIGNDGSTLIGNDGSTLIGNDGSTLIGNDGSTLIGNDGSTLIGNDGSTAIPVTADRFTVATGAEAISIARQQLVAAGGGNLIGLDGSTLVAAGGLN